MLYLLEAKNMNNINLSVNGNTLTINGQSQKLDPLMMRLLDYFITHQQSIISRQTLSETVWQRAHASDDAINRGISRLRKILGGGRNDFIKTVPKQGYLFALPKESCATFEISPEASPTKESAIVTTTSPTPSPTTELASLEMTTTITAKSDSKIEQLSVYVKNKWSQWMGKADTKIGALL